MDGYNSEKFQNKLVEIQKQMFTQGGMWLLKSKKIVDNWTLFYFHILQAFQHQIQNCISLCFLYNFSRNLK
jgi:hypothetical protein